MTSGGGYPCVIFELPEFDLILPLVCRLCGNCCRNYYVSVDLEILPEISDVLGEPIHAIQARLNEKLELSKRGKPADCCFLADNRCLIHKVKPEACRQFPSFTDAAAGGVDCPAHKEHKRIEKFLFRRYPVARVRLPSSSRHPRRAPEDEWGKILNMIKDAGISATFLQALLTLNRAGGGS